MAAGVMLRICGAVGADTTSSRLVPGAVSTALEVMDCTETS